MGFPALCKPMKPFPEIQVYADRKSQYKSPCSPRIHQSLVRVQAAQAGDQETDVRGGKVRIPQAPEYHEMPVRQGTVTDAVKYPQKQPGCGRQEKACQVYAPGPFPYPSEKIEQDQERMEDRKKNIQKSHT
jgi:hypothetical protein